MPTVKELEKLGSLGASSIYSIRRHGLAKECYPIEMTPYILYKRSIALNGLQRLDNLSLDSHWS